MKVLSESARVQRFVSRRLKKPTYGWSEVEDPRGHRGRRWKKLSELLNAVLMGFVSGATTLREVESVSRDLGRFGRKYVSRRAPDTTIANVLPRLEADELRRQLVAQVKTSWRAKELEPVGLPCGVATVDGKALGNLKHDACGTAQRGELEDGREYYLPRVIRAVLSSAESRPCLDQMSIAAKTNEVGAFSEFYRRFLESYGDNNDLFEIVDVDAGFASKQNAEIICDSQKAYVISLKENQPELFKEAERVLGNLRKPVAATPVERYRGKRMHRRLFVTYEMAGYHDWQQLKQVWRVEQITESDDGKVERENRYFLSSLHQGRLTADQILLVVRGHWRVENDCFWSLDMQWKEDSAPLCTTGRSTEILSWIRLMAYNLVQLLRRRHLRKKLPDGRREKPPAWKDVFGWIRHAWIIEDERTVCG